MTRRKPATTDESVSPPGIDRRSFLKQTALIVSGAAVGPLLLPRNLLGMNGTPGANDRVVIGIIGTGKRARQLLPALPDGFRVGAVADVYLPRAEEFAESIGVKHVYQDYRKLLERNDIDAVIIATPTHWHALTSIHAAQAGKDIFCEKPLSYSVVEGRRIAEAVRKYQRVFQTGIQGRLNPNAHLGCLHLRNGTFGKIKRIVAHNYFSPMEPQFPGEAIPEGLDWDMWCGPAEKLPYNFAIWDNSTNPSWVSVRPFSGGSMADWGSHGLDLAQWGLGMDGSGPEEVWVEGKPFKPIYSTPENPGVRQQGPRAPKVMMKYPGDIVMEFAGGVGWSGVRFEGEKGTITVTRDKFTSDPAELMEEPLTNPKVKLYRGHQYAVENDHLQDWLNCIKERRDPGANAEVGHRTTTLCHLANIARWVSGITGETGQRLKWDAKAETFTNSPEANRFLNPPRRKEYPLPKSV